MLLVWNCFTANSRSVHNNESDFNAGVCAEKKKTDISFCNILINWIQLSSRKIGLTCEFICTYYILCYFGKIFIYPVAKKTNFFCLFMSSNFWLRISCQTYSISLKDVSARWMLPVTGAWTHRLPSKGRSATSPRRLAFLLTAAAKWGCLLTWLSDMT